MLDNSRNARGVTRHVEAPQCRPSKCARRFDPLTSQRLPIEILSKCLLWCDGCSIYAAVACNSRWSRLETLPEAWDWLTRHSSFVGGLSPVDVGILRQSECSLRIVTRELRKWSGRFNDWPERGKSITYRLPEPDILQRSMCAAALPECRFLTESDSESESESDHRRELMKDLADGLAGKLLFDTRFASARWTFEYSSPRKVQTVSNVFFCGREFQLDVDVSCWMEGGDPEMHFIVRMFSMRRLRCCRKADPWKILMSAEYFDGLIVSRGGKRPNNYFLNVADMKQLQADVARRIHSSRVDILDVAKILGWLLSAPFKIRVGIYFNTLADDLQRIIKCIIRNEEVKESPSREGHTLAANTDWPLFFDENDQPMFSLAALENASDHF